MAANCGRYPISLSVATEKGEYGPVEDMEIFDHLIGSYLIAGVGETRGGLNTVMDVAIFDLDGTLSIRRSISSMR